MQEIWPCKPEFAVDSLQINFVFEAGFALFEVGPPDILFQLSDNQANLWSTGLN